MTQPLCKSHKKVFNKTVKPTTGQSSEREKLLDGAEERCRREDDSRRTHRCEQLDLQWIHMRYKNKTREDQTNVYNCQQTTHTLMKQTHLLHNMTRVIL